MNLISDPNERAVYQQAFIDLHDTFSKPITVWRSPQQVVVSTDPQFNGFYANADQPGTEVKVVPQSGVFNARIRYLTAQELVQELRAGGLSSDQKIDISLGAVRIRVSGDAVPWINEAERVTLNGESHIMLQRDRPHGLFSTDFFDFILQRVP